MRSGTLPTHQIVGMGEAFAIAKQEMAAENVRIKALSDRFFKQVSTSKSCTSTAARPSAYRTT